MAALPVNMIVEALYQDGDGAWYMDVTFVNKNPAASAHAHDLTFFCTFGTPPNETPPSGEPGGVGGDAWIAPGDTQIVQMYLPSDAAWSRIHIWAARFGDSAVPYPAIFDGELPWYEIATRVLPSEVFT